MYATAATPAGVACAGPVVDVADFGTGVAVVPLVTVVGAGAEDDVVARLGLGAEVGGVLGPGVGVGAATATDPAVMLGGFPFFATALKVTLQVPAGRELLPPYTPSVAVPDTRFKAIVRGPTTTDTLVAG